MYVQEVHKSGDFKFLCAWDILLDEVSLLTASIYYGLTDVKNYKKISKMSLNSVFLLNKEIHFITVCITRSIVYISTIIVYIDCILYKT